MNKLIWVHSHQEDPKEPCVFVCSINEEADAVADGAVAMQQHTQVNDVKIPAGLPRFYFTWRGKAIVENVGKFVRKVGENMGERAWAERKDQGRLASVLGDIYHGSMPLNLYYEVPLSAELRPYWFKKGTDHLGMVGIERIVYKLRMYIGGSLTAMLHYNAAFAAAVSEKARGLGLAYNADNPALRECVACMDGSHGNLRHVAVTCKHAEVGKLRKVLFSMVGKHLREAVRSEKTVCSHSEHWCRCCDIWISRGKGKKPGNWVIDGADSLEWPLLAHLGWFVPDKNEAKFTVRKLRWYFNLA